MEFKKYQHIERFGTIETEGIDIGMCYVFPKIDGANGSIWLGDELENEAGSRNRKLSLDLDNQGFLKWVHTQPSFSKLFAHYPDLRLYGEWLIPHTLKTYEETAWKRFYVFDVMKGEDYLPYDIYKEYLETFNIDYIPPICKVDTPTLDRLMKQLNKNGYLIKDGEGVGEGIVVKNYNYVNKFGRQTWAKIVRNDFKFKHSKNQITEVKEKKIVEQEIVFRFVTLALVEKEYNKIKNDGGWMSKSIPRLLQTVFYCLVREESWNFVKQFKNPVIDFRKLSVLTTMRVKELMPHLF